MSDGNGVVLPVPGLVIRLYDFAVSVLRGLGSRAPSGEGHLIVCRSVWTSVVVFDPQPGLSGRVVFERSGGPVNRVAEPTGNTRLVLTIGL